MNKIDTKRIQAEPKTYTMYSGSRDAGKESKEAKSTQQQKPVIIPHIIGNTMAIRKPLQPYSQ